MSVSMLRPLAALGVLCSWLGCTPILPVPEPRCNSNQDCAASRRCVDGVCKDGCTSDQQCMDELGTPNAICRRTDLQCVPGCQSNQQCVNELGTPYAICRKTDLQCVSLLSQDCTTVLGDPEDVADDNALIFGTLLPVVGTSQSSGLPTQHAVELARRDFKKTLSGLPPAKTGGPRRPLVFVACNDSEDARRAARHLVDDVGVPAIIGPRFSGRTKDVALDVTVPGNVLLISPAATSPSLSELQDDGLVWRTAPPDTLQAVAMKDQVMALEQQIRQKLGMAAGDKVKLAISHKGDSYGVGLADALQDTLMLNGALVTDQANRDYFLTSNYGDPSTSAHPEDGYAASVTQVLGKEPHIIILVGLEEVVDSVFANIEVQWPTALAYKPEYLLSDGCRKPQLLTQIANKDELRKRVRATVPGTDNANFQKFVNAYRGESTLTSGTDPEVIGVAGAYDSVYLLAYAVVTLGSQPITGSNLAQGLRRLVPPGQPIDVGSAKISSAITTLTAAGSNNIDFSGASGPLNFDLEKGEAPSDIQVWCVINNQSGVASGFSNTGRFFNASNNVMEGVFSCP